MVDNSDEVVCSILLDKKYDFVVVFSKSRTIGELRAEIDKVAREVYPEFGCIRNLKLFLNLSDAPHFLGGQVSRVENQRGSVLPDRYQVGILLENGSRVICYSSGGKERENVKKLRSQKVQTSETVRNKPSVTNNTSKHSLLEAKRTASDNVCGSSEDTLLATKYKSLFTIPEHCCPKRKEAIEVSACKVAEWLSVHDLSSNVDAQDSESDEGTMEVGSEYEGRPERVVGKRVRSNRKGKSDDDEHDNDVNDIDYDGDGSHSENTDSDNGDVSILESLSDRNQATRKTTTCYTPKGVRANRTACASVSTSKPKRKAVDCARKKNEALSTTSHGTQSNLSPSKSDRENRSTNNSALPSLAGNLPKCQVAIKRLPICLKHGRNWKVVHVKTRHETNKRRQRGDVMSNRGSKDKGKNKESTPMYLTPIKGGEQIAWLKQSGREDASEQTGDEYEDFMKRLEMSDCSITSDESKRSKTENRPPLSSVGQKQTLKGNEQLKFTSQSPIKKRSEQKQSNLQEKEDTLEENVNEEIVGDRRMISEETTEGNMQLKFTSQSSIKNRSVQKQRETLENNNEESVSDGRVIPENTTEGNVELEFTSQNSIKNRSVQKQRETLENNNEESVSDGRVIPENTTEGNVELEFTSQNSIKNRSVQKQRETLENNNEESVSDGRVIPENTTQGNVELEFTSQNSIKNRSVQKQRETLENNNEESVSDGRVISENTTEGNVELEVTSQSPIKKRSEQKQPELLESEDTLEDIVNEESVVERRIISEQILEGNGRFESISQSPTKKKKSDQKRGKVEDKDTLEENRNEGSVDERRIISEKTLEGNVRFEFTSPSPIKKRSEQTHRKLQENEDTLEENVNEESVDERRIISEKILEGNVRFESTSRSPTKKKRSDRKRGIVEDEVTLEENVHEESVDDGRMISEKTTEGNVELKFTPLISIKTRSVQKRRETLENNNEESVSDGRVISEDKTDGNGRFEFTSPSPIKKRSEPKQRNLQESEDTLEENVNEESVDERRIISEKSLEGNGRFELTSPSPNKKRSEQKHRKLQEIEDTLEKNVNVERVDERRITSEKILEGNGRIESTSQSPTKKKRSDRKRRRVEDLDTLEENVHEGSVDDRRMISEKTTEGNVKLKFTPQSPIKNRSVQKQRETLENNNEKSVSDGRVISEDTTEGNAELEFTSQSPIKNRSVQKQRETLENNNEKSVSDGRVISENTTEGNVELEVTSQSPIKKRSEQKQRNLQGNEDTLEKNLNEERVDERRIFSEKSLEENGRFEFTSPSPNKRRRSEQKQRNLQGSEHTVGENVNEESVDERGIMSEKTVEENGRFEFTSQSPNKRRRSEQKQRNLQGSEHTVGENVNEESVDERGIMSEKTVEENGRFEFTSQSPNKRRSEQKRRNLQGSEDTLGENVNEESVDERRIMSEKTVEENGRFEFTSQSPNKRRSEQKQRNLLGSEDTLGENVNEESVDERRIMSEKTVEENGRFEFTAPSSFKKRSEQKQQNLQENEGTLEENVNEESLDEKRIISEKTLEENGRFNKPTSRLTRKKRSDRKRRIVEDEVTLEENVHESVIDRGMISKKTTEGNVELKFTSQSPIKNRSVQKQRETLENNNEESLSDGRVISEDTTKGNVELDFISQSPIKKRSEQKQRNLQENEDTLEKNVNEERVDKRIMSEKTLKRNERFECTSSPIRKRSEQKQRNLQESEDTLEGNLNQESVDERRIMSEKTLEENGRSEFTSPSPIKKRSEQKHRKLQESEDTLEENVNEERVDERRIISEKILEGNRRFKFTSPSPNKKRSKQKQRKLQESEDTLEENLNEKSPSETTITSKKRLQNNLELECAAKEHVNNNDNIKMAVKRKASKRKLGILRKSDSQASVGMETPKKLAREDGFCEDKQNDAYKKTYDRKTQEGANNISDGCQEGNRIEMLKKNKKKKRGKRKEKSALCGTESTPESTPTSSFLEEDESSQSKDQQDGRVEREFASNVKNIHQISNAKAKKGSDCDLVQKQQSLVFNAFGEINFKKKDRYWEEKRGEDNEKSNDRKRSNQGEKVNKRDDQLHKEVNAQQSKKKMKKKEKRRKHVLNSMESATELPSSLNLETVTCDSLNDSGYGENGHNKSKQHEQCVPERVESVHQPLISKKRKAAANHEETPSGQGLQSSKPDADFLSDKTNSKKKSKTSLSLLDLALDAEQGSSNKATNRKTVLSEGRAAHQMARHFRQTPKGFLHPAKKRRITASSTAVVIRRKPRINRKVNVEMTAKERDLIASGISLEQLLDDESLWNA